MTKPITERTKKTLKTVAIIAIVLGIVIIIYPFFPMLEYKISPPKDYYPFPTQLVNDNNKESGSLPEIENKEPTIAVNEKGLPLDNYLVIPKIGVNIQIVEGGNEGALNKGAWHLPNTGNPIEGGNMVISAHRFRYRPPSGKTFYLLDKINKGDQFIIYWQQKEYDYSVSETKIVESDESSILKSTDTPQVTLFTCTPLFTTDKRLVVIGQPM